jgi:DNA-binding SARP family transcriptional activator
MLAVRLVLSLEESLLGNPYGTGSWLMSQEIAIPARNSPQVPVAFRLLGAFQVTAGTREVWRGPAQVQRMLVKLLAVKGAAVTIDELMRAIWDDVLGPGASPERVHSLAAMARRCLGQAGLPDALINERLRYKLDVPPALVDIHQFHELADRARELARAGDQRAIGLLDQAVALHRGEPLAGLGGGWVDRYRLTLTDELRTARLSLYEAAIRHGEASDRLAGLSELHRESPDDERVTWLLMHALVRTGQPHKALEVKQRFARYLRDEYGLDCGPALDRLGQRILNNDDELLMPEAVSFPVGERGVGGRRQPTVGPGGGRQATDAEPDPREDDTEAGPVGDHAAAEREPTVASTVYNVLSGRVDARYAVFGTQIKHGGAR